MARPPRSAVASRSSREGARVVGAVATTVMRPPMRTASAAIGSSMAKSGRTARSRTRATARETDEHVTRRAEAPMAWATST